MTNKLKVTNRQLISIGKIADREEYEVYVVGGYVRDLMMGRTAEEADIMVVGDAPVFATAVAKEFEKKPDAIYKRFGTALVVLDGMKIEFASARKESYEKTSRKPSVTPANFNDDLSRRDFTINAIAASLNSPGFGNITDLFGGIGDIENKTLRTPLDPIKTFEDDPLRIMRALRFASRLEFNIDPNTLEAMNQMAKRLSEDVVLSLIHI